MVRESESDIRNTEPEYSEALPKGKTAPTSKKRSRAVKKVSTPTSKDILASIESGSILTENAPIGDEINGSLHHQTHHTHLLPTNPFHQLSDVINNGAEDEEAEREASNDEFELISSQPVSPKKRSTRTQSPLQSHIASFDTSTTADTDSLVDSRRAKRASGEHLWKHRCFWDEEETEYVKLKENSPLSFHLLEFVFVF